MTDITDTTTTTSTDTSTSTSTTSTSTTSTSTLSIIDQLKAKYPNQYYCDLNKPCAWYNMWIYSSINGLPDLSDLYAMTTDEWQAKGGDTGTKSMTVIDGKLVDYVQPKAVVPLKDQATTALTSARTYIYNNYGILNEATPDDWVVYLKALMAISNGTDTTSTTIPAQPTS